MGEENGWPSPKNRIKRFEVIVGKGGVFMQPMIFELGELLIAGVSGDGSRTGEVWERFMELQETIGITNKLSDYGYEIRLYHGDEDTVHVGVSVANSDVDSEFTIFRLPPSTYAAFEVEVAKGYDSENENMDRWLEANKEKYEQRTIDGSYYVVEFYDERFTGHEEGSIVEIWIPLEEK
jgi:predicted transcriptional regulator YdeE